MILEQETYEKYGYKFDNVKNTRKSPIIIKCDYCNSVTEVERRKITRSKNPKHSCSNIECRSQKSSESIRVLNKELGIYPVIGNIFGKLTVIGEIKYKKRNKLLDAHNSAFVECKCECGNIVEIQCVRLKSGRSTGCGETCPIRKFGNEHINFKGHEKIYAGHWIQIQNNAKSKERKFEITIQQIWDLFLKQNKKCALTGLELTFETRWDKHDRTASLDRIDSSKDYTIDNVQWIHKDINRMKSDLPENKFIEYCKLIANYNQTLTNHCQSG